MAMIKQKNREGELALREMEMWSCLAEAEGWQYPLEKADGLWKTLHPAASPALFWQNSGN